MFTWGSKYLFGVSVVAWVGAVVYGLVTGGDPVGVLSFGYKGGVGDHLGYAILQAVFMGTALLGGVAFITRDGDAEAMAARIGEDNVPQVTPPAGQSYWGPVTAFGVACLILGVSVSFAFLVLGLAVLFVVGVQWMTLAWSDRATGDPAVNEVMRQRILGPVEIPMMGSLAIAVVVIGVSRIFLTVSEIGAVVAGGVLSAAVFGAAVMLSKTDAPKKLISTVVVVGAVAVLAGGVIGAVRGPRDFHHGEETEEHEGESGGEGNTEEHSEEEGEG